MFAIPTAGQHRISNIAAELVHLSTGSGLPVSCGSARIWCADRCRSCGRAGGPWPVRLFERALVLWPWRIPDGCCRP